MDPHRVEQLALGLASSLRPCPGVQVSTLEASRLPRAAASGCDRTVGRSARRRGPARHVRLGSGEFCRSPNWLIAGSTLLAACCTSCVAPGIAALLTASVGLPEPRHRSSCPRQFRQPSGHSSGSSRRALRLFVGWTGRQDWAIMSAPAKQLASVLPQLPWYCCNRLASSAAAASSEGNAGRSGPGLIASASPA